MKSIRTIYRRPEMRALKFLRHGPLERRRGGWRFGAASIGDVVVERLVAYGMVRITEDRVEIIVDECRQ